MMDDASSHLPNESGGMLLGYRSPGGDLVIAELLEGGPDAIRKPTRFVPDGRWQQRQLALAYERSGRIHTYLGDWHSHPGGVLQPSRRDRRTARAVARSKAARAPQPVTLIGTPDKEGRWRWTAFIYVGREFSRAELKVHS